MLLESVLLQVEGLMRRAEEGDTFSVDALRAIGAIVEARAESVKKVYSLGLDMERASLFKELSAHVDAHDAGPMILSDGDELSEILYLLLRRGTCVNRGTSFKFSGDQLASIVSNDGPRRKTVSQVVLPDSRSFRMDCTFDEEGRIITSVLFTEDYEGSFYG